MSSVLNMQLLPVLVEHCSTDRHWIHVKSLQRCECCREEWRMHLSTVSESGFSRVISCCCSMLIDCIVLPVLTKFDRLFRFSRPSTVFLYFSFRMCERLKQESPAVADKPILRESMPKIAPVRCENKLQTS